MLDPKHCSAFLAVAETGSFEYAGKKLHITASAVSLRLQAFERTLGVVLLTRTRPCKLTESGEQLKTYLQQTEWQEQNFINTLRGQTEQTFHKIKLGINADSLATWFLPSILALLKHENILLDIHIDDQNHTHDLLETGQVNACISTEKKPMKGCEVQFLRRMRYYFCVNRLSEKKWFNHGITRESLQKTPAIIFNERDDLHVNYLLENFGLMKNSYPFYYIPSSESFVDAIRLGLGYGFIPALQLEHQNLSDITMQKNMHVDVDLYWHHWQQQSKPLEKLTQIMLKPQTTNYTNNTL